MVGRRRTGPVAEVVWVALVAWAGAVPVAASRGPRGLRERGGGGARPFGGGARRGGRWPPAAVRRCRRRGSSSSRAAAAATCPGLPWSVLGGHRAGGERQRPVDAPGGGSGANAAGAEGPMQFEPATFAAYATVGPGGAVPPSPYDPVDAVYTAAALLCADGGGTARAASSPPSWTTTTRRLRGHGPGAGPGPRRRPVPRRRRPPPPWPSPPAPVGGPLPVGRDRCRAATTARGWSRRPTGRPGSACPGWPRTSSTPGRRCRPARPAPGDLVFFGDSASDGRARRALRGDGEMIDAPYTGTVVREDPLGSDLVGVTRPGG